MFAIGIRVPLPEGGEHLVPGTPEHALAQEILHHRPGRSGLSTRAASGVRSLGGTRGPGRAGARRTPAARLVAQSTRSVSSSSYATLAPRSPRQRRSRAPTTHTHRALVRLFSGSQSAPPPPPSPSPPSAAMSTRSVSSSSYRRMFGARAPRAGRARRSYVTTSTRTYSLGSRCAPAPAASLYASSPGGVYCHALLCRACGAACPGCGSCRTRWTSRWPTPSTTEFKNTRTNEKVGAARS
uniref:Vimentin n=1 Tax=Pan troglodytes TaxID=9598 RepID=K7CL43_PANTR